MNSPSRRCRAGVMVVVGVTLLAAGCGWHPASLYYESPSSPVPLGTLSDPIWQAQEDNAEPSKFVIYQHEFDLNTTHLNEAGADHVKQIAARLHAGQNFPVIIERSNTSERTDTEYKYPVHLNPNLDMRRRDIIVHSLTALGVPDAEGRVVVAPALTRGFQDGEAERAYYRSFYMNNFGGNFGSGFGGFGGGFSAF